MTNTEIKSAMRNWYEAYIRSNGEDKSYNELYHSLNIMRAANLITEKQWKMVVEYDHKLFTEFA